MRLMWLAERPHDLKLTVPAVRSLMRAQTRLPRLLVYRSDEGDWVEMRADDVNGRFRELVGDEFSIKDLRTWHGTVLAAEAFAHSPSRRARPRDAAPSRP